MGRVMLPGCATHIKGFRAFLPPAHLEQNILHQGYQVDHILAAETAESLLLYWCIASRNWVSWLSLFQHSIIASRQNVKALEQHYPAYTRHWPWRRLVPVVQSERRCRTWLYPTIFMRLDRVLRFRRGSLIFYSFKTLLFDFCSFICC